MPLGLTGPVDLRARVELHSVEVINADAYRQRVVLVKHDGAGEGLLRDLHDPGLITERVGSVFGTQSLRILLVDCSMREYFYSNTSIRIFGCL